VDEHNRPDATLESLSKLKPVFRESEPASHKSSAGAQLADVVASAFYQAADTLPPTKWNNEFAKLLKPIVAKDDGFYFNYGLRSFMTRRLPGRRRRRK
jgi:hypothetical protein